MSRPPIRDHILWMDLETTGSDEANDCIIEVGAIVTTYDLQERSCFTEIVKPFPLGLGRLLQNDVVREMHTTNGLLEDVLRASDAQRPHLTEQRLLSWLDGLGLSHGGLVLGGSGVGHFDRRFIRKFWPTLNGRLRYWVVDVGVLRRTYEMWVGPDPFRHNAGKTHRAIDDIRCHVEEARSFASLWSVFRTEDAEAAVSDG